MQHSRQDALDTAARRARTSEPKWHPIMAAREPEPGVWYMVDSKEKCYWIIRIIRKGDEVGYRVVTWAPEPGDRQLIGYYRTLMGAASAAHTNLISQASPGSHPRGIGG